jgi:chorismate-pyruvate lyase
MAVPKQRRTGPSLVPDTQKRAFGFAASCIRVGNLRAPLTDLLQLAKHQIGNMNRTSSLATLHLLSRILDPILGMLR